MNPVNNIKHTYQLRYLLSLYADIKIWFHNSNHGKYENIFQEAHHKEYAKT
jgi:hypothetical protein